MKRFDIDETNHGKKLHTVLQYMFPHLSSSTIYKTLRKKDIKVNGKRIHKNIELHAGDQVELYIVDSLLTPSQRLTIVYEDNLIVIVDKPSGMEVTGENSLTSLLMEQISCEVYPCHRLDRNTTGLTLFAKNKEALSILLEHWNHLNISKQYICHVYGIPSEKTKTLTAYLFKDAKKSMVYISNTPKRGYRSIITSYQVLSEYPNHSCLLAVDLHTGRTHQIRAHLSHIGLPIIGDGKYGKNEINKQFGAKTQRLCSAKLQFHQLTGILAYLNGMEFVIDYHF